jgi:serum/glucocorticoid-regulated kinase 2
LESQGYTKTVDWWTLGVLLYEMMVSFSFGSLFLIYSECTIQLQTGLPPFFDENVNTMYQRILSDPLIFPADIPSEARSVMVSLLHRDPSRRLGANGGEEIKRHPFFAKYIDWNR